MYESLLQCYHLHAEGGRSLCTWTVLPGLSGMRYTEKPASSLASSRKNIFSQLESSPLMKIDRYFSELFQLISCSSKLYLESLSVYIRVQLKPAGTPCRDSSNSCDLPEFCTGSGPHCPSNVYLHDGHACHNVDGYCYNGICQTHEQQCITLWGQGI